MPEAEEAGSSGCAPAPRPVYGYIPSLILVLYAGLDRIDPTLIEASQPILTGLLIQGAVLSLILLVVLLAPMIYYVIATSREATR